MHYGVPVPEGARTLQYGNEIDRQVADLARAFGAGAARPR
jgi:hypothetical protein